MVTQGISSCVRVEADPTFWIRIPECLVFWIYIFLNNKSSTVFQEFLICTDYPFSLMGSLGIKVRPHGGNSPSAIHYIRYISVLFLQLPGGVFWEWPFINSTFSAPPSQGIDPLCSSFSFLGSQISKTCMFRDCRTMGSPSHFLVPRIQGDPLVQSQMLEESVVALCEACVFWNRSRMYLSAMKLSGTLLENGVLMYFIVTQLMSFYNLQSGVVRGKEANHQPLWRS